MGEFEHGKSYPIDTLPDDLYDESIPATKKWAIRDALFWNDCQGWWLEHISDVRRAIDFDGGTARFWSPLPPSPMSREEICAERGWAICPDCDYAIIDPKGGHACLARQTPMPDHRLDDASHEAGHSPQP